MGGVVLLFLEGCRWILPDRSRSPVVIKDPSGMSGTDDRQTETMRPSSAGRRRGTNATADRPLTV